MNELCRYYQPHLPLYAEGELKDDDLVERTGAHVLGCADCREWLEDYEEFTRRIVAVGPIERASSACVSGYDRRVEAVMDAVCRLRRHRRGRWIPRFLPAAAVVLCALLGAIVVLQRVDQRNANVAADAPRRDPGGLFTSVVSTMDDTPATVSARRPWVQWVLHERVRSSRSRSGFRPVSRRAGDVRLIGFPRGWGAGFRDMPLRVTAPTTVGWILEARTEELFCDPLGGGWTFLLETRPATDGQIATAWAGDPVPLRRLSLERLAVEEELEDIFAAGDGSPRYYRVVVVPDPRARNAAFRQPSLGPERFSRGFRGSLGRGAIIEEFTTPLESVPNFDQY